MNPPRADVIPSDHLNDARLAALTEGDDPSDEEACHLLGCATCAPRISSEPFPSPLDDLPLLRAAPPAFDLIGAERRLLDAVARPKRFLSPYRLATSAALLSFAAAALLFVAVRTQTSIALPPSAAKTADHAAITPTLGSRLTPASTGADEVVVLEGEASFEVQKIPVGERFRVRVGADEVEVRGTRFTVRTAGASVAHVRVSEGVVEVRAACCPTATLRAGETWTAPTGPAAAPEPTQSADADVVPSGAPPVSAVAPAHTPSGAELLAQGTAAYDGGRYAAAAVILARAVATEPGASWARDTSTLSGAARVLSSPPASIPTLGVSVASFDTAATRARQRGDARLAAAAAFGAARHLSGKAAESRFCALKADGGLGAEQRKEAEGRCRR